MPKFASLNPAIRNQNGQQFVQPSAGTVNSATSSHPAMLMELPAGSMIVNGQYLDAKTLAPKFGKIPGPVSFNIQGSQVSGPHAIITSNFRQMTQLSNGLNSWLVSSYGRLNNNIYDPQYNKLHVYSCFPGGSGNNTGASPFNSRWGSVHLYLTTGSGSGPAYTVWDGVTEESAANININPAYASALAYTNPGYTPMAFRVDTSSPSSTRFLWCTQGASTTGVNGIAQLYSTTTNFQPLMSDTTNPLTFTPSLLQGTSLSVLGHTLFGVSNANTRAYLYSNTVFIWFFEMVSTGLITPNLTSPYTTYVFLKKMTYAGAETTIISYWPKGLDGTHWPTQNLQENGTSVSVIIPTFDIVAAPQIRFRKLVIDKINSSEIVSNLAIANDPAGTISSMIYRKNGYSQFLYTQRTAGGGTINDNGYRALKQIMTWQTTMPSGNTYIMMGVAQTAGDTDVNLVNYYKDGYRSFGNPQLDVNQQFNIWAWQLDAGLNTATYVSESDFKAVAPKYYFPLSTNWDTLYVGSMAEYPVDRVYAFNEQLLQWREIQSFPYNSYQVAVDGQNRLWTLNTQGTPYAFSWDSINLETVVVPYTASVTFANVDLLYLGTNISTTANVDVFDAYGTRKSASLTLTVVGGGMTFADGTTSNTFTTSSTVSTLYEFTVTGASYSRVVATINQVN